VSDTFAKLGRAAQLEQVSDTYAWVRIAPVHLRPPAIAHGVTSFLWALFFGLFIWIGGSAVGFSSSVTFIAGCVGGFLIFVFVRVYGEDEPGRP
jgi:hypothetical protein